MGTSKGFVLAVTIMSASLLLLGIGTLGAKPDKPNPNKPIPGTEMVLVPKISLQGGQARAISGARKRAGAATGFLGQPCAGNKYAIVIGISQYPGTINDLDFADDDADDITQILDEVYGFDFITTLKDGSATRAVIMNTIAAVRAQANAGDEVVFFFSGHGMTGNAPDGDAERTDEAIVVNPSDTTDPFADYEWIWDGELRTAFKGFDTDRIIFIFDVCMAGGMDDLLEPGRVLLMAAGERANAYEGPDWQNGEFTYYLAEGIETGAANVHDYAEIGVLSSPILVTAEEAFDYAKANCDSDRPVIGDGFVNDLLP